LQEQAVDPVVVVAHLSWKIGYLVSYCLSSAILRFIVSRYLQSGQKLDNNLSLVLLDKILHTSVSSTGFWLLT
jgi:hypothetical protein